MSETRRGTAAVLGALLRRRILVLDGAMGTLIQAERLDDHAFLHASP